MVSSTSPRTLSLEMGAEAAVPSRGWLACVAAAAAGSRVTALSLAAGCASFVANALALAVSGRDLAAVLLSFESELPPQAASAVSSAAAVRDRRRSGRFMGVSRQIAYALMEPDAVAVRCMPGRWILRLVSQSGRQAGSTIRCPERASGAPTALAWWKEMRPEI